MNYQEAERLVSEHNHLIGMEFNGRMVSNLLIAPLKEVGIAKLMYNYANDIPSGSFYKNYSDFDVWVIFDMEEWEHTGVLSKILLKNLLPQLTTS